MVNVANKTISNFIDSLTESDKKELTKLLSEDDVTLNQKFDDVKKSVVTKLTEMKNNNEDNSTQTRIDETISKVISEDPKDQKKVRKRFEEILSQSKKDYDRYESNKKDNKDDYDEDYDDDYSNI